MTTELYTMQTVALRLGVSLDAFKYWVNQGTPEVYYVEPAFVTVKADKANSRGRIKLWTSEQVDLIEDNYQQYQLDMKKKKKEQERKREEYKGKTRPQRLEYNRAYYWANHEELTRRGREYKRARRLKEKQDKKEQLARDLKELAEKAEEGRARNKSALSEFDLERQEKAMQILMGIK